MLDLNLVRPAFPALASGFVFLDNAGGSQTLAGVADRVRDYLLTGNVQLGATYAASHAAGERVRAGVRAAAALVGTDDPCEARARRWSLTATGSAYPGPMTNLASLVYHQGGCDRCPGGRPWAGVRGVARSLALGLVATMAGCGITDFDVEQPVMPQTIQGSGIPAPLAAIFPLPLSLDLEAKIKAKDTGPIDSVTLSSLSLHITSSGSDWSFVNSIDVSVESTKAGTTLPKVKIASVSSPGAVQTLNFDVEGGVNLKPYIDEGSKVDSSGTGTQPTRDVSFDGKGVFTVHPL